MQGDKLAAGARSATFTGPRLKFSEGEFHDDLSKLSSDEFIEKYRITRREYDLHLAAGDEEAVSTFAVDMAQRAKAVEEELARDAKQEDSLSRECFLIPFVPMGFQGRVIVSRDRPPQKRSNIALPKSMRKEKMLLPTTGHVIVETIEAVQDHNGKWQRLTLIGKRVLFSPMSGTAICFKNYPTWIQLELSEILAIVDKEDVDLIEEELEPMV